MFYEIPKWGYIENIRRGWENSLVKIDQQKNPVALPFHKSYSNEDQFCGMEKKLELKAIEKRKQKGRRWKYWRRREVNFIESDDQLQWKRAIYKFSLCTKERELEQAITNFAELVLNYNKLC